MYDSYASTVGVYSTICPSGGHGRGHRLALQNRAATRNVPLTVNSTYPLGFTLYIIIATPHKSAQLARAGRFPGDDGAPSGLRDVSRALPTHAQSTHGTQPDEPLVHLKKLGFMAQLMGPEFASVANVLGHVAQPSAGLSAPPRDITRLQSRRDIPRPPRDARAACISAQNFAVPCDRLARSTLAPSHQVASVQRLLALAALAFDSLGDSNRRAKLTGMAFEAVRFCSGVQVVIDAVLHGMRTRRTLTLTQQIVYADVDPPLFDQSLGEFYKSGRETKLGARDTLIRDRIRDYCSDFIDDHSGRACLDLGRNPRHNRGRFP